MPKGPGNPCCRLEDFVTLTLTKQFARLPVMNPLSVAALLYVGGSVLAAAQVAISYPSPGAVFSRPQIVAIQAIAATNASEVDFYQDDVKKAAVTNSTANTFAYNWIMTSTNNGTTAWTAVALDSAGQNSWTSSVASVRVQIPESQPPVILVQPRNRKVVIGRLATFGVIADGAPPVSYQWVFNDAALPGETNASLQLTGVKTNLAGSYSVTVSNAYGFVTSTQATLKVVKPLPRPSGFRINQ